MAFQEIIPTRGKGGNRAAYHASYKVMKNGVGILLITAAGMEKLASLGRTATAADRVRTFHDPATGRIALRWEATGPFKLRQAAKSSKALALGSRTLAVGLANPETYLMEGGEGFDVVLVPVK